MKSLTDNISSEVKTTKGFAYDSRWMIISAIALALFLFCLEGRAQLVSSNPMEYVALAEGNELINSQIKNQIEDATLPLYQLQISQFQDLPKALE